MISFHKKPRNTQQIMVLIHKSYTIFSVMSSSVLHVFETCVSTSLTIEDSGNEERLERCFLNRDLRAVRKSRLKNVYNTGFMIEVAYLKRTNTWVAISSPSFLVLYALYSNIKINHGNQHTRKIVAIKANKMKHLLSRAACRLNCDLEIMLTFFLPRLEIDLKIATKA